MNYLSIENISIISVISPIIKTLIIDRLDEIVSEILLAKQMFDESIIDSVVVLSEIGMTEQIIIQLANQKLISYNFMGMSLRNIVINLIYLILKQYQ